MRTNQRRADGAGARLPGAAATASGEAAGEPAGGRRAARTGSWLLLAIGVAAFAARLGPVLAAGTLRGVQGYDDGVHLAVAERLIAGILPYRDEVFLHPPGIAVLLAPVAALAGPLGDSWSLVLARVLFMVLGAVNAVLIARILAPRGRLAAGVGGGAYAVGGAAVSAEHTVFLETPINLGLLVALAVLAHAGRAAPSRSPATTRALVVSGIALGLAITFKIWVAIDIVVIGAMVVARWGLPTVWRWFGWCLAGAAPVVVPFFVLAPGQLWFDVIAVQSGRPIQDKGLPDRLGALALVQPVATPAGSIAAVAIAASVLLVVLAPLMVATWRRIAPSAWPDPAWWGVLAGIQLLALALAPSFYVHYAAFVAPAMCLLLGAGTGHVVVVLRSNGGPWAGPGVAVIVASAIAVGLILPLARLPLSSSGQVDTAALAEFAARHDCLWARNPSYLELADATARQVRGGCPATMDIVGAGLLLERGGTLPGLRPASNLDDLVLGQLAGSDGALLTAGRTAQGLGPRARAYRDAHFARTGRTGEIEMWTRTH